MCSDSERKVTSSTGLSMEGDNNTHKQEQGFHRNSSILLELSAVDDLGTFKRAVEEDGHDVDESSPWYGRRLGSKKIGFEDRTPLMIAAMYGSVDVLSYILQTGLVAVNRACGSDGATALHCAAAGGACRAHETVKLLLDASADINCVDANGSRPGDVISPCPNSSSRSRKMLEIVLKGEDSKKKEYPIDPSLPDIKNGIYSTDEFRMYTFKVKPCSRAYSHDWTECPFVHPGENARRRDPRKYHYSCVPCPEFKKGSCGKGDGCEYAHGIFECWLHPAQYRTRLCKDETNCTRRVCFFAHKPEELRPLYASTGSAVPSPRSMSCIGASPFDMACLSPPMTPTGGPSSPMVGGGVTWQGQLGIATPPALQLPGSRLKTTLNARNMGLETELLGLSLMSNGEIGRLGAGLVKPTSLDDVFGSVDPAVLSQSPTGLAIRQNLNQQIRSSYSSGVPSSPLRSAAFAKRSQSFIDRGAVNRVSGLSSPAPASPTVMPPRLSDWGSPDGKLDWGIQGEELSKLRKSASFGFRSNGNNTNTGAGSGVSSMGTSVSWVRSPAANSEQLGFGEELKQRPQYHLNSGGSETIPSWLEQLYMEQEQMVA